MECFIFEHISQTMSINSWCLIPKNRHLTQNLTRLPCTDEAHFSIFWKSRHLQQTKRALPR